MALCAGAVGLGGHPLLLFDWLRFAATRFYSQRERLEHPNVRATLDAVFGWIALAASLAGFGVYAAGLDLPLSPDLAALAIGVSITNGCSISPAPCARRFLDKSYGMLVVAKNLLAFALTVGGAFWSALRGSRCRHDAQRRGRAVRRARRAHRRRGARRPRERALGARFLAYGLPIIGPTSSISPFRCSTACWSRNRSASPRPDNIRSLTRSAFALSARSARRST